MSPAPAILVTGATGFIGRHVVAGLAAPGQRIVALARRPPGATAAGLVEPVSCDLLQARDDELVEMLRQWRVRAVVHVAWDVSPGYWTAPGNLLWLEASLRLARALVAIGGKRFVSVGSCAEYDWSDTAALERPLREAGANFAPQTLYAAAKRALHATLAHYGEATGLSVAWALMFFPIGAGERAERLVPQVVKALAAGAVPKTTSGAQIRDFIDVRDAGAAIAALASSNVVGPVNIASGSGRSVRELIEGVRDAARPGAEVAFGALPIRPGDPPKLVADIRRLTHEIGFTPRYDFNESVRDAVAAAVRA